jgi:putative heme-binding domain-containing protein
MRSFSTRWPASENERRRYNLRHSEEVAMFRVRALRRSVIVLTLAAAPVSAQTRALAGAGATDLAAGQKIFDAQCAWCHGANGTGGTGPNLQRPTLSHAAKDADLVQIVRNGIPGTEMPSFAIALTDRMAWQTAAYVKSLGRARARALPGNARNGAALYESNGCASCHIVDGHGTALGPELTRIGALRGAPYLRDALITPAAAHPPGYLVVRATRNDGSEVRGIRLNEDVFWILVRDSRGTVHSLEKSTLAKVERQMGATLMPSYATRLSDAQLDDLVAYLSGLRGDR